jgi:DNA-binding transcriptional ArsR family regulator
MEIFEAVHALSSLAHDTRLGVFRLLVQAGAEGMQVGRIGETLGVAAPTLSFHLKELTHAGLVLSRQEGRFIYYRANYDAMNALLAYLTDNCCQGEACLPDSVCKPNDHGGTRRPKS